MESERKGSLTVKGIYHLFLGNTLYTLLLALTTIAVARILGPSEYGLYTVALIFPPLLFTAIRLGLDAAATRFAARLRSDGKEEEAVSFVYAMTIFGVAIATASALVFVWLSGWIATSVVDRPQLGAVIIPIGMLSVLGQAAFYITNLGMTGLGKFDKAGLTQALQGVTKLVTSVGLVVLGYGVTGAVAGYTISFVVTGGLGVVYIAWLAKGRFPKEMKTDAGVGLRYGFPIYLSTLIGRVVAPVISIALALKVANSQIGGYSVANTFTSLIALATYPIATALFPLFSRRVDDYKVLGETYANAVRHTALLVIPVTAFTMAFSGPLVATFYGNAYAFGASYVTLVAAMNLLAGVGSLAWDALLNGIGRTRDVLVTTALGSGVSVVGGVGLMVVAGVAGAIIGQTIGAVVSVAFGTWIVHRRLKAELSLARVWKFYVAAGLAAGLSWLISFPIHIPELVVIVGGLVFIILYIPLLALLKALNVRDIDMLRDYLKFSAVVSTLFEAAVWYYNRALLIL